MSRMTAREKANTIFLVASARFVETGNKQDAVRGYMDVLQYDSTYAPAYFNLGILAAAMEDWAAADSFMSGYLQYAADGPLARRAHREREAARTAMRADSSPEATRARKYSSIIARARLFADADLLREALAEAAMATELDPRRPEAFLIAGALFTRSGDERRAVDFLSLAEVRSSDSVKSAVARAREPMARRLAYDSLMREGTRALDNRDFRNAAVRFSYAARISPDRDEAKLAAGLALGMNGDYGIASVILYQLQKSADERIRSQAYAAFEKLRLRGLTGATALLDEQAGQIARAAGAGAPSVDTLDKRFILLIERDPKDVEVRANYARALVASGRWNDAEAQYRQLTMLEPQVARWIVNLGAILLREKRWAEAESAYVRALQLAPAAETHSLHATALSNLGQREKAVAAVRAAIALQPDNLRYREQLDALVRGNGRP